MLKKTKACAEKLCMPLFLLILFINQTYATNFYPKVPSAWVEMNSLSPVILTWAYADPDKKLIDTPSLMVQEFSRNEKLIKFVNKEKLDSHQCREVKAQKNQDWDQVWCLRKDSVLVLLSKGDPALVSTPKETLLKWVHSYE